MIRWVHETKAQPVTDRNRLDQSKGQQGEARVTDRYQFQSVTNWIQLIRAIRQFSLWLIALALLVACQTAPPPKEAAHRRKRLVALISVIIVVICVPALVIALLLLG